MRWLLFSSLVGFGTARAAEQSEAMLRPSARPTSAAFATSRFFPAPQPVELQTRFGGAALQPEMLFQRFARYRALMVSPSK